MIDAGITLPRDPRLASSISSFQRYLLDVSTGPGGAPLAQRLIQECARQLVEVSQASVPIDPRLIASFLSVDIQARQDSELGELGRLVPVEGGFRAYLYGQVRDGTQYPALDEAVTPTFTPRGRFTLAHELGHALFYSEPRPGVRPERLIPVGVARSTLWREEGLCHAFARELLLPHAAQHNVAAEPSIAALVAVARRFAVSKESVARRLLYDWGAWQYTILIYVGLHGSTPRVSVFRGQGLRRRRADQFSRPALQQSLSQASTPSEAAHILRAQHNLPTDKILVGRTSVWAIAA